MLQEAAAQAEKSARKKPASLIQSTLKPEDCNPLPASSVNEMLSQPYSSMESTNSQQPTVSLGKRAFLVYYFRQAW